MIYTKLTKQALELCFEAHRRQLDKSGLPYVFHPFHVAEQMTDELSTVVALLHDVVEDTSYTLNDLKQMGYPSEVTEALRLLTHDPAVPFMDYIAKLKQNPIARDVKLADLRHNSDLSRLDRPDEKDLERVQKYQKAIALIDYWQEEAKWSNNTTICCLGALRGKEKQIEESFDWLEIACTTQAFTRSAANPRVFSVSINDKPAANLAAYGRYLCAHPMKQEAIEEAIHSMEKTIAGRMDCRCAIHVDYHPLHFTVFLYQPEQRSFNGLQTGDVLTFGSYAQREKGERQPIRWRILNINETEALLISEKSLMTSGYCDGKKAYESPWYTIYGNSLAREMCNGVFYETAFDSKEKECIIPQRIDAVSIGPVCTDAVFLLSEEQVRLFFRDEADRRARPTDDLLMQQGESSDMRMAMSEGFAAWWLLPQENDRGTVAFPKAVWPDGIIQYHGRNIYHRDFTIRPCICVRLDEKFENLLCKARIMDEMSSFITKLTGNAERAPDAIGQDNGALQENAKAPREVKQEQTVPVKEPQQTALPSCAWQIRVMAERESYCNYLSQKAGQAFLAGSPGQALSLAQVLDMLSEITNRIGHRIGPDEIKKFLFRCGFLTIEQNKVLGRSGTHIRGHKCFANPPCFGSPDGRPVMTPPQRMVLIAGLSGLFADHLDTPNYTFADSAVICIYGYLHISLRSKENGKKYAYSFDIEKASDSHYTIKVGQEVRLISHLQRITGSKDNSLSVLVAIWAEQQLTPGNAEHEVVRLLNGAGVLFDQFHCN